MSIALAAASATAAAAQEPAPQTRQAVIEQAQGEKVKTLRPPVPNKGERIMAKAESILTTVGRGWYPVFDSAYTGGGFALGVGYRQYASPYSLLDVRGSYSIRAYKLAEVEFTSPRLFHRRGKLSLLGGWREATQVGFFGLGMNTSKDDRTNYGFEQPYASATLTLEPTRRFLLLRGGLEWSRWKEQPGQGAFPSIETAYSPAALPGIGAEPTYIHSQGTVGFDWRTSRDYSRRGGFYGVTLHDYEDRDERFGFRRVDYELIQHVPMLREAWVVSLRGRVSTTFDKTDQHVPFFMLPAMGGGSTLRGYSSFRFRDRNSLLLQAEWRIMASRYLDSVVFYDAAKVTSQRADLDLDGLKSDFGFGVRFHGPFTTPFRVDLARSREGLVLVFGSSSVF
ncbi:MAG TPA: BamA/TamA family outer membrane protein [Vicinamibacterales bacterium]|nr:BamA/TamA family outer membrane protein [Vicinamibacterales bacterium]